MAAASSLSTAARAQSWTGASSTDWFTPGNWSPAAIPTSATDATIDGNGAAPAVIGAAGAIGKGVTVGGSVAGALDVTGAGALSVGADGLIIGDFSSGNLTVEAGGNVTVASGSFAVLGNDPGGSGAATVTGAGSLFDAPQLYLSADHSNANLIVSNGGNLTVTQFIDIADVNILSSGNLTVTGSGARMTTPEILVGEMGTGQFKLLAGATANGGFIIDGDQSTANGTVDVDGAASVLTSTNLTVGNSGAGSLSITGGGVVNSSSVVSMASSGGLTSSAQVLVDGAGSKWTTGNLLLGDSGTGNLTISNGGSIVTTVVISGQTAAVGSGNATVTGAGSSWEIGGAYTNAAMSIGLNGFNHVAGNLSVLAGGSVTIDATATDPTLADVRLGVASDGHLLVDGAGSHFTTPYNLYVGLTANQTGTVVVSNGGNLTTGFALIANAPNAGATDSVTVTGPESIWTIKDTPSSDPSAAQGLDIGGEGPGLLTIANGATVTLANLTANVILGSGTLNVGAASASPAAAPGTLNAKDVIFSTGSPGSVNFNHTSTNYVFAPQITGAGPGVVNIIAGTTIFTADDTYAGNTTISPGATLQLGNAGATGSISGNATDNGAMIFDRTTAFTYAGSVSGSGNLTQAGAGTLTLHGNSTYSGGTIIDSGDTLALGDLFGDGSIVGAVNDQGSLIFFRTANLNFAGNISGAGNLTKQGAGNLTLSGNDTYSGATTISTGRLIASGGSAIGDLSSVAIAGAGALEVASSETIGALSGFGNVTLDSGAVLTTGHNGLDSTYSGNIAGAGNLTKAGVGNFTLGGADTYSGATTVAGGDLFVNGNLASPTISVQSAAALGGTGNLAGAVTVANGGTLIGRAGSVLTMSSLALNPTSNINVSLGAPSTSGLFQVDGALTLDGNLNITDAGGFGAGTYRIITYTGALTDNGLSIGIAPAGNLTVQTSIADQVNLIFTAPTLGSIEFWNGTTTSPTGTVVGGAGTWIIGPTNWTDAAGDTSGNWAGGMAIFEGAPGAVTIDDSAGSIQATDIQFAVDGYSVGGGNLTLAGGAPTIRVGDGSSAGAGYTATISAPILGTGGLIKTDLGTLVLSATNTYTGGTTIEGGTLSVGADANLGGAGNLTLDGGNLTVTGSFASARTVDVEAAGGINVGSGDTLNLTGNLTDSAALTKSGAGVLEISGAGAYAGALGVAAGALEVNGSLGAATVTVQSGATLAGSGTLGGPVIVANGGHLVGVEGQTLTMGALTLNPTSNLDVSLRAPSSTQLFQVNGALTLDGTLNITDAGGFGAGTYRLIDYTGALTDNGLSLGTAPAGNLTVQTSVANQVNLVFATAGSGPLQFWNGTTTSPTGTVVAGNGTWRIGPTNWTDAAGDASGAWTGGFAIFQATPGTVTIDNSTGAIDATGLQFAVSGYTVAGGALTLAGATPTIRVGDSSAAGAGYTATISAPIAGTGGLVKTDLGTLVLTGASSLSGGSTVAAGRLAVEGSLANSAVTVADGATLGGNGVVGGVIAQAGALVAPGDSIGALGVSGNYAQAAGSTYQVELDAAGHADRINVSGAASLAGGAVLDVIKTDSAPYVFGTRYTVLSAAGGVTGTYTLTGDTIPVTPFIGLVVDYDADDVYLDVGKIRSFASAGATPNEIAAGRAADDLPLANDLANVLANLPTIGAAHAAFNQVSGEIHASVRGAMLEDGRTLRDGVIDHLIILADGDPGVWGEAVTGSRRLNGDGNAAAAQGSDTTLMAGLDNALGPVILGVVGGYETGGLGVEARASSANLQGWHVAAYGQADLGGGWGLRGVGGYSGWTADISRMVSLPGLSNRLSSRDSAGEGQAYAELGWTAHLGAARVQPFIGAGWSWLQGSSFAERGGAAALNGRGLALDIGSGKAGVRLDAEWRGGGVTIRPHAALAWELGFDGRLPLVDVGFPDSVSGAAYAVSGPTLWRDRADVDLGVDLSKGGFTLGAGFIGQYADRASQEGFNAHVDWDF